MNTSMRLATVLLGLILLPLLAHGIAPAAHAQAANTAADAAPRAARTTKAAPAEAKRVDINGATEKQLEALPGIGPARAKAIIAARPFAEASDLVNKKVLTPGVLGRVKDRIALANINMSSAADMERTLTGVGDVRSKAIVAGRPYATPQDLVAKGVLTQAALDGIKDQITY